MSNNKLCIFCFDVILSKLDPNHKRKLKKIPNLWLTEKYPLFVTWETVYGELRGCIGTFKKDTLKKNLTIISQQAAFKDRRFKPITKLDVPNLVCEVSLLINFTPITKLTDWVVGTHGISIKFSHKGINYSSTYLPEVAKEFRFTKMETIKRLVKKSGFVGDFDLVREKIRVTKYGSVKFRMRYSEYKLMNAEVSNKEKMNYIFRWKVPFVGYTKSKDESFNLIISKKMFFYRGYHLINNLVFTSLTIELDPDHKVIFIQPRKEESWESIDFDIDDVFIKRILDEQLESKIRVAIPRFVWFFIRKDKNIEEFYFNHEGISKKESKERLLYIKREIDLELSEQFLCIIVKSPYKPIYHEIVSEFHNPWANPEQRRAIYAKYGRARKGSKKWKSLRKMIKHGRRSGGRKKRSGRRKKRKRK